MRLTGTLRPGARLSRPSAPPPAGPTIAVMGGDPRVGAFVTVTGTEGRPCYVQVCAPGTENFDRPFIEADLYQPVPMFQLGHEHLGHTVRVIAKGVDPVTGLPNGQDVVSNVIGPILHQVDPAGTTVASIAELAAAVTAGASTIILAAGTDWTMAALQRTMANVRITTPQSNPARLLDSFLNMPGNISWTNVVLEGLIFRQRGAWAALNGGNSLLTGTSLVNGLTLRSCKQICDNVPPEIYQAIPALPLNQQPGWGTRVIPTIANGFDLHRSRNIVIEGHFARNVNRAFLLPNSRTVRHLRIHGWYGDGIQIHGGFSQPTDRGSIRDYILSDCYSVYNEQAPQAPHPDGGQITAPSGGTDQTVDGYVNCIGNTRAYAYNGTINNWIVNGNAGMQGARFRRCLLGGIGSINVYLAGSDISFDQTTRVEFGAGAGAIRFGGSPGEWDGEGRLHRVIARGPTTLSNLGPGGYFVESDSATNLGTATPQTIFGDPLLLRPETIADLALMARPRLATNRGALLPSGHMRPFAPFPTAPGLSATPTAGGFNITVDLVDDAESYEVRYRPVGSNGAWTRQVSIGRSFTATNLGSGIPYTVQAFASTPDGLTGWSDPDTVTTGTIAAATVPSITWEPSGEGYLAQFDGANTAARTHLHPIQFGAAPNGTTPRLSLLMLKQRNGLTGSPSVDRHRFTDATGAASLGEITSYVGASITSTPGSNARHLRIGFGTPAAGASHVVARLSTNTFSASYQRCGVWSAPVAAVAAAALTATTITLSNVPPGARIVAMAMMIGTAPGTWSVANGATVPPAVTLVDAEGDTSSFADSRVEVVTIAAPTGGTFTITCAGATIVTAAAFA